MDIEDRKKKLKVLLTDEVLETIIEAVDVCAQDSDQWKLSFIDWCSDLAGKPRTDLNAPERCFR